ncbi:MAG: T9SS type A sorting domain-containing protein [Bacteroidota bacterium]
MKRLSYTTFAIILISAISLLSQPRTGLYTVTYTDRDVTSTIYFSVPTSYDSTKSYPMILGWHGAGDGGNNMRNAINIWLADQIGAIVVCPDANSVNNHTSDYFSNLANAAYSQTRAKYNIDTNKRIIMGFSWGGGYSYQFGLLNPQLFTGIIGLAPAVGSLTQAQWDNIKKLRMATILGTLDFNYTSVNALMNQIKTREGSLLYIIKPGVQHADNVYFNSEEIKVDLKQCYDFIVGVSDVTENEMPNVAELTISPNPATDYISISLPAHSVKSLSIFNSLAIELNRYDEKVLKGLSSVNISTNGFSSGIYYCTFNYGSGQITKSFLIVK